MNIKWWLESCKIELTWYWNRKASITKIIGTWGTSKGSFNIIWEDIDIPSVLVLCSNIWVLVLYRGLYPTSLFWRKTSRALTYGFEDDNEMSVGKLPSVARWRSKPKGSDHIDATAWGSGMETTSPAEQKPQKNSVQKLSIKVQMQAMS